MLYILYIYYIYIIYIYILYYIYYIIYIYNILYIIYYIYYMRRTVSKNKCLSRQSRLIHPKSEESLHEIHHINVYKII